MLWASARAWDTAQLKGLGRMGHLRALAENALIAGLATLPIAAFHFGQVALAGVLANVLAVPVLGFFVLPAALLTVICMPFGPAGEALRQVLWAGCWVLNHMAVWVAGLPYTVAYVPVWMGLLFIPACLLLIFWVITHRWRAAVLGLVALGAGIHWLPRLNTPADLVWFPRQQVLLVRGAGGYAATQNLEADAYTTKRLVQAFNRNHPLRGSHALPVTCDSLGCTYGANTPQSRVLVPHTTANGEDCAQNALILGDAGPCGTTPWPDETSAVYIWLGPHVTYRAWQPDGGRIWSE
jgi:competence protein ComEC